MRSMRAKVMGAQFYDALVTIPGCDKNMPGATRRSQTLETLETPLQVLNKNAC